MLSDDRLWELWNAQGTDDMSQAEAMRFARAIEAEVRKDYDALIRQMLEALTAPCAGEELLALKQAAIAAARARLLDSDLSKLTERGAKAWAGVDPQKLREGKAL